MALAQSTRMSFRKTSSRFRRVTCVTQPCISTVKPTGNDAGAPERAFP